jgi:transcriptional regulator with XRE-family HTH domain
MAAITCQVIELPNACGLNQPMNTATQTLPVILLQARKARRLSQLELSLRLGVSQRHVSFVECGRARPGRELLLEWLRELDVPLSLRNETMLKAGYAPAYSASRLDAPELAQANEALVQLLRAHDPMPAMVMDAEWNVLHMNRGGVWLAMTLMPWAAGLPAGTPLNMLDLLAHPEGFTRSMVNLPEVAPAMMLRLRDETAMQPGLSPKVEAIAALLRGRLGEGALHVARPVAAPVLTTRFATPLGELAFFSMFTTFGTPQDITLASLRLSICLRRIRRRRRCCGSSCHWSKARAVRPYIMGDLPP